MPVGTDWAIQKAISVRASSTTRSSHKVVRANHICAGCGYGIAELRTGLTGWLVRSLRGIAAQLLDPTQSFSAGLGGLLDTHSWVLRAGSERLCVTNRVGRKPNGAVGVS